mgnify:CR=1 FL=1
MEMQEELKNINATLGQLLQGMQTLKNMQDAHAKQLQQTRNALEQLAGLQDLEFIEALNMWVSKKKWAELKKDPR